MAEKIDRYYQAQIETASGEELREIQSRRLIRAVKSCYENVPFYKKKFDEMGLSPEDIKSIDDISKLPLTEKQDLRDNYPFGLFAVGKEKIVRVHASSGTTGKQTVVGYTKKDIDTWSNGTARALVAVGATNEDYIHISYGYGLFTGGLGLHYGAEKIGAAAIPVSSGNTSRQIQIIQDYGSNILCCTPSYAVYIGETLHRAGISPDSLKLRAGIFGAEPWSENMRLKIEELLGLDAYDIYGLSEIAGPGVSFECRQKNGLHVCEDYFYPEIIDPETLRPLPDGLYGELVFTCIGKEALPLIRYRTRDITALTRKKCECGRTLVRMRKPKGRTDDMLIIRGVNVFPSQVEHVILSCGIEPNYQIIVDRKNSLDTMTVKIEMNDSMFSDSVREIESVELKIKAALMSVLGVSAGVMLVEPRTLPRSEGKAVRVIDNRKD
ncbi:MAG: Phenylacetate-coenzyme A ligase [Firmicutes bacterium ADurb.Bin300]|jgi:phenylacetate-CoA ligase|nr:MAG: Phenylacetate-coenzyme A ligase [Firmicutes bacterium ADurb.Bin300]